MKMVVHCKRDRFDVYIGRPSRWGNPFSHQAGTLAKFRVATRDEAVSSYRAWILGQPELLEAARRELKGKVLGCFCSPLACHGDVLVEIANSDVVPGSNSKESLDRGVAGHSPVSPAEHPKEQP